MEPFPPGSKLVAYFRDSGGADQELSVPQQEAAAHTWCKSHGYILSRIFADIARSGKSTAGRGQFLEMIDYLGDAPERGVVIWEFARFSRDIDDLQFYLADLRRSGVVVHSLNDNIPEGLEGRLFESILAYKNAKFLQDLARNVRRGLGYVTLNYHAYTAPNAPTGYRKTQKTIGARRDGSPRTLSVLEPDPLTGPRVRLAFEMKRDGRSRAEIHAATRLLDAPSSYARMFRNPIYTGVYREITDFCEPLIDRDTFDAVQERAAGFIHPRRETSAYLLSGLVRCAACGRYLSGFTVTTRGIRYRYYRCVSHWRFGACTARMIPAGELEILVIERLKEYLSDPAIIEMVCKEVERLSASVGVSASIEIGTAERELSTLRAKVKNVVLAIREAGHSAALLAELAGLEKAQSSLEQQVRKARRALARKAENIPEPDEIRAAYEMTRAELDTTDQRKKQLLLRSFVGIARVEKTDKVRGKIEFNTPTGAMVVWSLDA